MQHEGLILEGSKTRTQTKAPNFEIHGTALKCENPLCGFDGIIERWFSRVGTTCHTNSPSKLAVKKQHLELLAA